MLRLLTIQPGLNFSKEKNMSTNNVKFSWASDENANLREPIDALKNSGWKSGDIPTASNFNWLLNTIEKDLKGHQSKIADTLTSLESLRAATESNLATHRAYLDQELDKTKQDVRRDLGVLKKYVDDVEITAKDSKKLANQADQKADICKREATFVLQQLYQACEMMTDLENQIKVFHPQLRTHFYPQNGN